MDFPAGSLRNCLVSPGPSFVALAFHARRETRRRASERNFPLVADTADKLGYLSNLVPGIIRQNRTEDLRLDQRRPRTASIRDILEYSRIQTVALSEELPIPPPRPHGQAIPVRLVLMIAAPLCVLCGVVFAGGDAKKRRFLVFMCGCPLITAFVMDLFNIHP
jgi:hypothetical protein